MFFLMSLRILKKTPDDFFEEDSIYTGFKKIKLEEEFFFFILQLHFSLNILQFNKVVRKVLIYFYCSWPTSMDGFL